jgi:hypothetical protein
MMINIRYAQRFLTLVMATAVMSFGVAQAEPLPPGTYYQVNTVGILDNDERGAASNVVLDFHVGAGTSITSLRWDVNVTSYVGSYLSEMKVTFSDTLGHGITFTPGDGDDFDGTMDYAGLQDFGELGQVFQVGDDGILRLEFHDGFKDLAFDEPEGVWNSGTLIFGITQVPEPPVYAMALGGLLLLSSAIRRRRP